METTVISREYCTMKCTGRDMREKYGKGLVTFEASRKSTLMRSSTKLISVKELPLRFDFGSKKPENPTSKQNYVTKNIQKLYNKKRVFP